MTAEIGSEGAKVLKLKVRKFRNEEVQKRFNRTTDRTDAMPQS